MHIVHSSTTSSRYLGKVVPVSASKLGLSTRQPFKSRENLHHPPRITALALNKTHLPDPTSGASLRSHRALRAYM